MAATKLLDLAGFKDEEGGAKLQLVHSNPAILSVILQRLGEGIQRKKNEKMTKTSSRSSSNPPQSKKMTYALKNDVDKKQLGNAKKDIVSRQSIYSKQEEENETKSASRKSVKTAADSVEVAVRLGGKEEVRRKSLPLSATLQEAVTALLGDDSDWKTFEIRYPNPRRNTFYSTRNITYSTSLTVYSFYRYYKS